MNIILKSIKLTNFKGIRNLKVLFNRVTDIFGDNGTGKTTIADAFLWLLFGKDTSDRKDFEIKTLDENNEPFHRLDHEVEALLLVDGTEVLLKRSYREKWVKKRGSNDTEFAGHETTYFWNDVPMKQDEYQAKIADMLQESVFKLITNTNYFSSLKWQDRRNVLLKMAGDISDADVFKGLIKKDGAAQYEDLIFALNKKSIDEYKREIGSKKKKIKDELLLIPSRIDEANRSLPDVVDYSAIESLLGSVESEIVTIDKMLSDKTEAQKERQKLIGELMYSKQNLNLQANEIEFDVRTQVQKDAQARTVSINERKQVIKEKDSVINKSREDYSKLSTKRNELTSEQTKIREQWNKENETTLVFNDADFCCPTCKRAFEATDIDAKKTEFTSNFNSNKSKKLEELSARGKALTTEIKEIDTKLGNINADGVKLKQELAQLQEALIEAEKEHERLTLSEEETYNSTLSTHEKYISLHTEIAELQQKIDEPVSIESNTALTFRKSELNKSADEYKKQLATKDQREKTLARIQELEKSERDMSQELSTLEGIEFSIDQFTRAKMDALEATINGKFNLVKFKLFDKQINGGEVECCDVLINGVPFADANTASKMNAGLDIINALSKHYNVNAPIFIDNRESVVRIPATESQIINLWVAAADKKLRIETQKETLFA